MSHLTPCPSCRRHVRASETRCPFCQKSFSEDPDKDNEPILFKITNMQALALAYGPPARPGSAREQANFRDDKDDDLRSAPKYGAPPVINALPPPDVNDLRSAPKYGGPPLRRLTTSLIFVGGIAIIVYLTVWR
jgi:hypothetical protein